MKRVKERAEDFERKVELAAEFLCDRLGEVPAIAVVLGSGWDVLIEEHRIKCAVDFKDVPGFAVPTVAGHKGRILNYSTKNGPLLVQDGRLHCYEGLSALDVSFPVFAYARWGLKAVVMLSAAGGLNPLYIPGDLMIVRDHIFLFGENPLTGFKLADSRSIHANLAGIYKKEWREAMRAALPEGTRCEDGVYAYLKGPTYETDAEAAFLRMAGADAVGMSSIPEAVCAVFSGLEVAMMCCISNTLLPSRAPGLTHEEVLMVTRRKAQALEGYLDSLLAHVSPLIEGL